MIKPRVIVFSGYGLNCEEETLFAFKLAGAKGDIAHINDLIANPKLLKRYQIFAMPGGFSYGDDTGSGNAYAKKLKNHLIEPLNKFMELDTLGIGICNGFQILTNLGVFGPVALLPNDSARYSARWTDLELNPDNPWFSDMDKISLPIAHGEGRFYTTDKELEKLKKTDRIAAVYTRGEVCKYQDLKTNPNGSLKNIAGITDDTGRVLGMMPHPERAISFTHLPHWTYLKEKYLREGKPIPQNTQALQIFKNAVKYFA